MSVQTGEQNTLIIMSEHLQLQFLHSLGKLTSKNDAETVNLLFAGNKVFVSYQTKVGVNPNSHLCTPLADNIKTMVSDKMNYRGTRS